MTSWPARSELTHVVIAQRTVLNSVQSHNIFFHLWEQRKWDATRFGRVKKGVFRVGCAEKKKPFRYFLGFFRIKTVRDIIGRQGFSINALHSFCYRKKLDIVI